MANASGAQSPAPDRPSGAGAKVTIACKIAVPWIELQLCQPQKVMENTQTGPREITQFVKVGRKVRIRGTAYPRGTPPTGFIDKPMMVGGYALTQGVDKEFWDAWAEQHKHSPYIESGMILAHERHDMVRDAAKERVAEISGLEPMRTDTRDARVPRSSNIGVTNIETEESRRGQMAAAAAA